MRRSFFVLLVISIIITASSYSFAATTNAPVADVDAISKEELKKVPPILDPQFRHRKKYQLEFSPYGGAYLGNSFGQTWAAGARQYFWLNNTTGLGVNYGITKLLTNRGTPFGSSLTDTFVQAITAEAAFSNDAALRVGTSLIEMDFYMTLGVGAMEINSNWEPTGLIGGGVKVYTPLPWLAFRIDVNNYAHMTPQPGKDPFDFDVTFLGGVSFLFPTNPSPYEKK